MFWGKNSENRLSKLPLSKQINNLNSKKVKERIHAGENRTQRNRQRHTIGETNKANVIL